MFERQHLFAQNKLNYVRGERPAVDCILCAVEAEDPGVENLVVYQSVLFLVSVNLYPYNPGHLMIFPRRHVEWPQELTEEEVIALHHLQSQCIEKIKALYQAPGFNLGYNLGPAGGGSINHLHLHIVPRFPNEMGFMGTIAQTHIMVEPPQNMLEKFRHAFANGADASP